MLKVPNKYKKAFQLGYCELFATVNKYIYGGSFAVIYLNDRNGTDPLHTVVYQQMNNQYIDYRGVITSSPEELYLKMSDEYAFGDKVNIANDKQSREYLVKALELHTIEDLDNCWLLMGKIISEAKKLRPTSIEYGALVWLQNELKPFLSFL